MRTKALWAKEYRSAKWIVWLMPILHFLSLGLPRMNEWLLADEDRVARNLGIYNDLLYGPYDNGSLESGARLLLALAALVLTLIQLGAERRNGTQELLFSLPYGRWAVFGTKWLFGVSAIAAASAIGFGIDMLVVAISPMSAYFDAGYHASQFVYTVLAVAAVYSLWMWIGTITGSLASQAFLLLLLWILPTGITFLIDHLLSVHGVTDGYFDHYWYLEDFNSLFGYLALPFAKFHPLRAAVLSALLTISFLGGVYAYERNRTENNGKLVLFPGWERVLVVCFVVCFTMLWGLFGTIMLRFGTPAISYYIGAAIGFAVGLSLIRRLTRLRLKI